MEPLCGLEVCFRQKNTQWLSSPFISSWYLSIGRHAHTKIHNKSLYCPASIVVICTQGYVQTRFWRHYIKLSFWPTDKISPFDVFNFKPIVICCMLPYTVSKILNISLTPLWNSTPSLKCLVISDHSKSDQLQYSYSLQAL